MSTVRACLFDLDGVIVDTAKYHFLAWRRLAQELGFEFTKEQNERLKGVSRMQSLEILLEIGGKTFSPNVKEELAAKKNLWYVEYITTMQQDEILPGATEFLLSVRQAGLQTALGSASKNAMTILHNVGLVSYFDSIIDGTKTAKAKPDPEVFLLCAKELGVKPANCVVFEDAKAGIEAARNAGMHCIGIGTKEDLPDADLVVPSLASMTLDQITQLI